MSIYKNEGGKAVRYGGITTVDSTLSKESMNPIQNKVVTEALDTKPDVFVYPFCTESDTWSSDTLQSYEGSTVSLYSTPIDYDKVSDEDITNMKKVFNRGFTLGNLYSKRAKEFIFYSKSSK